VNSNYACKSDDSPENKADIENGHKQDWVPDVAEDTVTQVDEMDQGFAHRGRPNADIPYSTAPLNV
jgi:hypothetical protein